MILTLLNSRPPLALSWTTGGWGVHNEFGMWKDDVLRRGSREPSMSGRKEVRDATSNGGMKENGRVLISNTRPADPTNLKHLNSKFPTTVVRDATA